MKALVITFRELLGIDLSIFYTILARVLQAGGALIVVGLISLFLTKEEQGYYYTFSSVIAIQVFFELGLTSIITQYVAHEAVDLKWISATELVGPPEKLSRIASILMLCLKVFGILSALLFVLLLIGGLVFFSTYKAGSSTVSWQLPWGIMCLSTALMLTINPLLSFLEGLGQVKEVAQLRMRQQLLTLFIVVIVLSVKGGLYAQGIASLMSFFLLAGSILFSANKILFANILRQAAAWKISYRKEIFPYHYKIALSWISGYLIFQLFNPILFATEGPVVAGQMGITLAALNGVSSISMSWINTKITLFSSLVARKEYSILDTIFNKTVAQLAAINAVLLIIFVALLQAITLFDNPLNGRFLPFLPVTLLCVTVFINQFVFSWATYLRCHKKEPFLWISVLSGILCMCSSLILGKQFGVMGMVTGYTVLTAIISGLGGYYVFVTKKREWHQMPKEDTTNV